MKANMEVYPFMEGDSSTKEKKSKILNKTLDEIKLTMHSGIRGEEIWGSVFEIIVKAEIEEAKKEKETQQQKLIRKLIEDMYEKAEIILGSGKKRPSKPDKISTGYEGNKIVIDRIIEIKSTAKAYEIAHEKEQPIRSIDTIQKLVTIINQMLRENDEDRKNNPNAKFKPVSTMLSLDQKTKRNSELSNIRSRLKQIRDKDVDSKIDMIAYSPDLKYVIQIPHNVKINGFSENYLLDEYELPIGISLNESVFSKTDIWNIIENFSEQSSN